MKERKERKGERERELTGNEGAGGKHKERLDLFSFFFGCGPSFSDAVIRFLVSPLLSVCFPLSLVSLSPLKIRLLTLINIFSLL